MDTIAEWKDVTLNKVGYRVSRIEYGDRIEYTAWEEAMQNLTRNTKFMSSRSHNRIFKEGRVDWGAINERNLPPEIEQLTPKFPARIAAEGDFWKRSHGLAHSLINRVYPDIVMTGRNVSAINGQIIVYRNEPVKLDEPKKERGARSVVSSDRVKEMLEMVDMPRMQQLAKLNGIPLKLSDTAGLLKMRLSNAFRKILKDGKTIVEK